MGKNPASFRFPQPVSHGIWTFQPKWFEDNRAHMSSCESKLWLWSLVRGIPGSMLHKTMATERQSTFAETCGRINSQLDEEALCLELKF